MNGKFKKYVVGINALLSEIKFLNKVFFVYLET